VRSALKNIGMTIVKPLVVVFVFLVAGIILAKLGVTKLYSLIPWPKARRSKN
jgi:hypothetical protein